MNAIKGDIEIMEHWQATRDRQAALGAPTAYSAPRLPRRERMCTWVRELGQATAMTLREMNPTPTEWWQILGIQVLGFVCTALHAFRPVATLAVACWLYVWLPTLTREAHRWCVKPRQMSWRGLIAFNERQAKKPRKRLDDECFTLGIAFVAIGLLGGLVLAIGITTIGA